jgi:hypothetical protein
VPETFHAQSVPFPARDLQPGFTGTASGLAGSWALSQCEEQDARGEQGDDLDQLESHVYVVSA